MDGEILSAFTLPEDTVMEIEKRFSDMMGERVKLTLKIEPNLIGGITVTIGDKVYDGSIRNQLNRLEKYIVQG